MGIGIKNQDATGILYKDNVVDINEHISSVNKAAQKLYSMKNSKKGLDKNIDELFKIVDVEIKNACKQRLEQIDVSRLIDCVRKKTNSDCSKITSESINNYLDLCLRKSLYRDYTYNGERYYIPEVIAGLLIKLAQREYHNITSEQIAPLYKAVYEDYHKDKQLQLIANSIEASDVRVQVKDYNGRKLLALSNADNRKKHYIFDFMKEFSTADVNKQKDMMIHIRELILLLVCGPEKYYECEGSDLQEWSWGTLLPEPEENFSDEVFNYIKKADTTEYRKTSDRRDVKIGNSVMNLMKQTITLHYRNAIKAENLSEADKFWIQHFETDIEKLFSRRENYQLWKNTKVYICKYLWRNWRSYMAMKYVDIGKAVYHFAMPDIFNLDIEQEQHFGVIQEDYINGITSFDYELIKAEESLNRDISTHITLASNVFAMNTVSNDYRETKIVKNGEEVSAEKEDVLFYKDEDWNKGILPDSKKKILAFFGGARLWEDSEIYGVDSICLAKSIKELLAVIRNNSYHYSTAMSTVSDDAAKIAKMFFVEEKMRASQILRKRYYSNNVPKFYRKSDIDSLMTYLYKTDSKRVAQIPAYDNIIKKKDLLDFIKRNIKEYSFYSIPSQGDIMNIYKSTMYFLFKDIYYYGFLQDVNLKKYFLKAVKSLKDGKLDASSDDKKNNDKAHDDFICRIEKLSDRTVEEICQIIMTEYNMQNQQIKDVKNGNNPAREKYKHYRMLLYIVLQAAFIDYIKSNTVYEFMRTPQYSESAYSNSEEDFCKGWNTNIYDELLNACEKDNSLYAWYIASHFMTKKNLNLLLGDIRNYKQFVEDIYSRSETTENRKPKGVNTSILYYGQVEKIIQFTMLFCGQISNVITDYFDDDNAYAAHFSKYVDFWGKGVIDPIYSLKEFCERQINGQRLGFYCDELNPILNRNVVVASMFGYDSVILGNYVKIKDKDFNTFYDYKNKLEGYLNSGKCEDAEEQKILVKYQQLKNKLELTNVVEYSEILCDLMSQLVSWTYKRERDLMYFQLGMYYISIFYGMNNNIGINSLVRKNCNIVEGAILYQIVAMNTHGLSLYNFEGKRINNSVREFLRIYSEDDYVYGLGLFENTDLHTTYVKLRNDIAHLKYFANPSQSIFKYYRDIFNEFFSYDTKLNNSVPFVLKNILLKHYIELNVGKMISVTDSKNRKKPGKMPSFSVNKNYLNACRFEYKAYTINVKTKDKRGKDTIKKETLTLPAKSDEFIEQVAKILSFEKK